ncbi:ATP-binding protein [Hymenobacter aerilatus]|uniref:histidine kinase n=1 Tax=Hymenobacter aerilatus TaxID=2932251 RepID=A0A8T9T328_9BACT|nr:ATP-binding protein [Hymenobacter aerilatus]UOR07383.1 ATP-binding protein [Hymenobacter aerilatus]
MLIRQKLITHVVLLVLGIQLGFSALLYYANTQVRAQRFAQRLTHSATIAGRLLARTHQEAPDQVSRLRLNDLLTLPQEQISIYGPDRRLRYSSSGSGTPVRSRAGLDSLQPGQVVIYPSSDRRETVGLALAQPQGVYRVFVSAEDQLGWTQVRQLGWLLGGLNVGALLLAVGAGWLFASAALRPVARLTQQARRISVTNLGHRLPEGNNRDELAQLAQVFNTMLAGLEQAFAAQSSFLSHASHELRTPLTTLTGTLETALAYDETLPAARQSLARSLEATRHLSALTNGLLNLAKADGALPAFTLVRLDECLNQALEFVRTKYPGREFRLSFGAFPTDTEADLFMAPGNAELLTAALLNLLDNAGKYSAGPVLTELAYSDAHTLRVQVRDSGPGLSPDELRQIYEPLYRATGAVGRPGYGLGLPLSQRVVQRHGGRLELVSTQGQGTTAIIWLPAAPL